MSSELRLTARQTADFELLANGGFAPLQGFQGSADWESVVETMRLAGGGPWPIPVTLPSAETGSPASGAATDAARQLWSSQRPRGLRRS